jgi:N-methylhydantoinase B
MELNTDAGGEGRYTGGRGIRLDYRIRADNSFLTAYYTRSKFPAWSLAGGNAGSPNYIEVIRNSGDRERFSSVSGLTVMKDDVVRIVTGNGGGLGSPAERDRESVRSDVRNGLISHERAAEVYGLIE